MLFGLLKIRIGSSRSFKEGLESLGIYVGVFCSLPICFVPVYSRKVNKTIEL